MAVAHQKQSRSQLRDQKDRFAKSVEKYYGKKDLLQEYVDLGIDNEYTRKLAELIRKLRVQLENKGAL